MNGGPWRKDLIIEALATHGLLSVAELGRAALMNKSLVTSTLFYLPRTWVGRRKHARAWEKKRVYRYFLVAAEDEEL